MSVPKWNEEREQALRDFVGDESPVSQETVAGAAEALETSSRSISSKLRKIGYEVEKAAESHSRVFSDDEAANLQAFVEANPGEYTYGELAAAFADGKFTSKQLQGKIMSMELGELVKPTPKAESTKTYSDEEEATFVSMADDGAYLEDIAEVLGRSIPSVRGKALSLLRSERINAIPKLKESHAKAAADVLEGVDVENLTVEEIAEATGKTPRGIKTMLTRRGINCANYKGADKAAKKAEAA